MRISTAYPQQLNANSMFVQQGSVNESQMKISSGKNIFHLLKILLPLRIL